MKNFKNLFRRKKFYVNINTHQAELIDFLSEIANSEVGKHNPQERIYKAKSLLNSITHMV